MFNRPKILIGTDFSSHSDMAIKLGKKIAQTTNGSITLVHISGLPPIWDWMLNDLQTKYLPEQLQKGHFSALSKAMNEQMARCGISCDNDILFGDPFEEFHRLMEKIKPNLLILGHGREFKFPYIGSLAQKMISTAKIPVFLAQKDSLKKIGGLVDPSLPSDSIIHSCEEWSYLFSGEPIYLSTIPDMPVIALPYLNREFLSFTEDQKREVIEKTTSQIAKLIDKRSKPSIKVSFSKEKIHQALLYSLVDNNIDVAVMVRHNKGTLEKFFIGSVSRKIIEKFEGNLLVLPE